MSDLSQSLECPAVHLNQIWQRERDVEGGGRSVRRPHNSPFYSRSVKDVSYANLSSSPKGKMEFWHF